MVSCSVTSRSWDVSVQTTRNTNKQKPLPNVWLLSFTLVLLFLHTHTHTRTDKMAAAGCSCGFTPQQKKEGGGVRGGGVGVGGLLFVSSPQSGVWRLQPAPPPPLPDPECSHNANKLYGGVYVKCERAQRSPLSDGEQSRSAERPRSTRA